MNRPKTQKDQIKPNVQPTSRNRVKLESLKHSNGTRTDNSTRNHNAQKNFNTKKMSEPRSTINKEKRKPTSSVYTDGSCTNNGKGGIGVYYGPNNPKNKSAPIPGRTTSNKAEIVAATCAVESAGKSRQRNVDIETDSKNLCYANKNLDKWKKNNWQNSQGVPLKDREELQRLDRAKQKYPQMNVTTSYVRAHSGNPNNDAADRLARQGTKQAEQNTTFFENITYGIRKMLPWK